MNTTMFVVSSSFAVLESTSSWSSSDLNQSKFFLQYGSGSGSGSVGLQESSDQSGSGDFNHPDIVDGRATVPDMSSFCASHPGSPIKIPQCSSQKRANYSRFLSIALVVCIAFVMFAMGCNVQIKKLRDRIIKPWGILIGFICQFGIMPLCAFTIANLMHLSQAKALVVLIMGCLPGGNASNLVAYWLNGDMDLSIAMTATSTIFAFAMMPLCLLIYSRAYVDQPIAIPFANISILLAAFVIPVGLGILINYYRPNWAKLLTKVGGVLGVLVVTAAATIGIILYPAAFNIPSIFWVVGFILPFVGYVLGYLLAQVVSLMFDDFFEPKQKRTIAIETGMQNAQLCTTIIQLNYGCTCMILEMYAYPLVYFLFQIGESLLFCLLYQIYKRCSGFAPLEQEDMFELPPRTPTIQNEDDRRYSLDNGQDENANSSTKM